MGSGSQRWVVRVAAGLLLVASLIGTLTACAPLGAHSAPTKPNLRALDALSNLMLPLTTTTPTVSVTPSVTGSVTPTLAPTLPNVGPDGPPPAPPTISATAAELYDATTGKTLYSLSPNLALPMASTTKIMTAVVALTYGKLDQMITVGPDTVAIEDGGTSVAGLRLGEQLSLKELLYCLLLPSGDDAAITIADGVAGSQANFVALMNLEAGLLGLSHTHYANPHGLDAPDHHTSVSDLVRLTQYAIQSPTFAQVVGTTQITLAATSTHHQFDLLNTNELLQHEPFAYSGAIGIKTGFTGPAGYCLVFMAKRPGGTLIGAVLGDATYDGRFIDAAALLNWAYNQISPTPTPTASASPTAAPSPTASPAG
ncbi:MAG TPA: D-alanyl-D-alanine carboxypeptidase [Ktedonobacterales bacterium]|nr:D-alanyl-D-alanine carboxypeptidase [Ktedonobacterales bacterium]